MLKKQVLSIFLVLIMAFSVTACNTKAEFQASSSSSEVVSSQVVSEESSIIEESEIEEDEPYTMSNLVEMEKEGKITYITNDEGYVTWMLGDFYDKKISTDVDSLVDILRKISTILGMNENTQFLPAVGITDDNDYSYYTFNQAYEGESVLNAIVKIVADPEGNVVALSSSFVSGLDEISAPTIDEKSAIEVVREFLSSSDIAEEYIINEDVVDSAVIRINDDYDYTQNTFTFIVYTNNPDSTVNNTSLSYLAHYVSASGNYLYSLPVASIGNQTSLDGYDTTSYFENKKEVILEKSIPLTIGETLNIKVPTLYDELTGEYYLADPERKIIVLDGLAMSENTVKPISTTDNTSWNDADLISYSNYIDVYDFYADFGWKSVDGIATPIGIISDYRDSNGEPSNNACYMGLHQGFQTFGTSYLNNFSEAIDIIAHEYTHGFTVSSMKYLNYYGEPGAINESFSDIMGNIAEYMMERTDDKEWLMGEQTGTAFRSMSNPNQYSQPLTVGDFNFIDMHIKPYAINDCSGVHTNNSFVSNIAYKLNEQGISLENQKEFWVSVIACMTPDTGFNELLQIMHFAADVSNLSEYKELIDKLFVDCGLVGDFINYELIYDDIYGGIEFTINDYNDFDIGVVWIYNIENPEDPLIYKWSYVNEYGVSKGLRPEGKYNIMIQYMEPELMNSSSLVEIIQNSINICYTQEGWVLQSEMTDTDNEYVDVQVIVGETIKLPDIDGKELLAKIQAEKERLAAESADGENQEQVDESESSEESIAA